MPNGQTDVFRIGRGQLVDLLESLGEEQLRGLVLGEGDWREYSVTDVVEILNADNAVEIPVEEQDGETYIVHIGKSRRFLVEVKPSSRLHHGLRRVEETQD